jgi:mono/diheme cytochrome c family protein
MMRLAKIPGLTAAWLLASASGFGSLCAEAASPDFSRDIEPIFIKRCYECHGPDQQKSKLRFDSKADAIRGGKSGTAAIVPGKSGDSELIARVTSTDSDEVMPPKGERLEAAQVAALRAWIDAGAVWPEKDPKKHWSFVMPVRPQPPTVENTRWVANDIDRFILARLEKEGLTPTPEVDRATLIRRLSFDLTGLPPTLDEVSAFVADRDKNAYEKLVDRLLASPHHGENMARWWLDLARYADSNGYQVDSSRSMWPYRDWVIHAFNRNLPFDQFTIEQLAGDLLPNATLGQKIATGFSRSSKTNDEGGGDDEEYRTKAVKDRVATTATTWLGLTMMCAECHTHKYDPITQEDYYRFYAFFNNTADRGNSTNPGIPVPSPPVQGRVDYLHAQIAKVQEQLAEAEKRLPAEQDAWERRVAGRTPLWKPLQITRAVSTGGATFTNLADGSVLATGINPIYDTYLIEGVADLPHIKAILLEVLPDPSLPRKGPGRWRDTGNFILDEMALAAMPSSGAHEPMNVAFQSATSDWEQRYYRAEHAVDRNPKTGWAIAPRFGQPHFLIAELKSPIRSDAGAHLSFRMDFYHGNSHTIGRLRLSVASDTDLDAIWPMSAEVAEALAMSKDQRTPEQKRRLAAHYRTLSPEIRKLEHELFVLNERESELATTEHAALVMKERDEPRTTHVHVRGNFLENGKEVKAGVPSAFLQISEDETANRLALAKWLVATNNPLTARVTVNRLWERVFGTGIVKTSEDFGRQGELPSHPELLDWLACEFMTPMVSTNGGSAAPWDLQHVLKLIVMSAAYRQNASADDIRLEKDPYDRLLSRGSRFRMDAEMIRDQALAVSGLFNPEIGGPSVYPVQVPNLWKEIGFLRPEIGMDEWPTSTGPELYRRGLYPFWRRVCTYPTFATFDAPSRDVCISRRPRTNTPLQALAALNEPTLLEAARVFAQRILREGGTDPAKQMDFAFRTCLSRPPTRAERDRLLNFYRQQLDSFSNDPASAEAVIAVGSVERPASLDARTLAAWMMVANALLNLDETVTKG